MTLATAQTVPEAKPTKRANGQGVPAPLADLSRRDQETFERDFKRATAEGSPWRQLARGAGRAYTALGWRWYRDAVYARPRLRKGPNECHDAECPCVTHRRTTRRESMAAVATTVGELRTEVAELKDVAAPIVQAARWLTQIGTTENGGIVIGPQGWAKLQEAFGVEIETTAAEPGPSVDVDEEGRVRQGNLRVAVAQQLVQDEAHA